jgi:hypothetical protein
LFVAGLACGIVAALTGQINLLAPWLLLSYAAFVGGMLIGVLVLDRWTLRLEAAAVAASDGGTSDGLREIIADAGGRAGTWGTPAARCGAGALDGGQAVRVSNL